MRITSMVPGVALAVCAALGVSPTMASAATGKGVYQSFCSACHGTGITGAPILGNTDNWAPRVAKGRDQLHHNALYGYTGPAGPVGCGHYSMMPKGGFMHLTDLEVTGAVDYMIEMSGAKLKVEPEPEVRLGVESKVEQDPQRWSWAWIVATFRSLS